MSHTSICRLATPKLEGFSACKPASLDSLLMLYKQLLQGVGEFEPILLCTNTSYEFYDSFKSMHPGTFGFELAFEGESIFLVDYISDQHEILSRTTEVLLVSALRAAFGADQAGARPTKPFPLISTGSATRMCLDGGGVVALEADFSLLVKPTLKNVLCAPDSAFALVAEVGCSCSRGYLESKCRKWKELFHVPYVLAILYRKEQRALLAWLEGEPDRQEQLLQFNSEEAFSSQFALKFKLRKAALLSNVAGSRNASYECVSEEITVELKYDSPLELRMFESTGLHIGTVVEESFF